MSLADPDDDNPFNLAVWPRGMGPGGFPSSRCRRSAANRMVGPGPGVPLRSTPGCMLSPLRGWLCSKLE